MVQLWIRTGRQLTSTEPEVSYVAALAVGLNGKIYSGSADKTIRVWCGVDGTHLQTLCTGTHIMLLLSQWGWTARYSLALVTKRSECGVVWAPDQRRVKFFYRTL